MGGENLISKHKAQLQQGQCLLERWARSPLRVGGPIAPNHGVVTSQSSSNSPDHFICNSLGSAETELLTGGSASQTSRSRPPPKQQPDNSV